MRTINIAIGTAFSTPSGPGIGACLIEMADGRPALERAIDIGGRSQASAIVHVATMALCTTRRGLEISRELLDVTPGPVRINVDPDVADLLSEEASGTAEFDGLLDELAMLESMDVAVDLLGHVSGANPRDMAADALRCRNLLHEIAG